MKKAQWQKPLGRRVPRTVFEGTEETILTGAARRHRA